MEQCLKMFKVSRIDFLVIPEFHLAEFMSKVDAKVIPNDLDLYLSLRFLINKTYPQSEKLLADFNKHYALLEKDGILQSIAKRHGYGPLHPGTDL